MTPTTQGQFTDGGATPANPSTGLSIQEQIAALQSTLGSQNEQLAQLQSDIASTQSQISDLEGQINNPE